MNRFETWVGIMAVLAAAACTEGTSAKGKADLSGDVGTTLDAVETTAGGRWTEVQVVESAHPYEDFASEQVEVRGAAGTTELRIVFDRFELETGYDFVEIRGAGNPTRHTGTKTGQEILVAGDRVTLTFSSDYSISEWGYRIRVLQRESCVCTGQFQPVCGADGQTYENACTASCSGAAVAHTGECRSSAWARVGLGLESDHSYANDFDYTWTIHEAGASNIRVHFASIDVERGYDFVRVLDASDRVIATYTGAQSDVLTPDIPGDTARVQLVTDYSVTRWGFAIDYYEATPGCAIDADCGPGRVCQQVQCIRAPCFAICQAAGGVSTYQDVTVEALSADPQAYNGQMIRVTGEPGGQARCTRRACTSADPCCNGCSANFVIGQNIELRDPSGQGYGCSGDECSWRSTCRAFQPEANGPYLFEGRFSIDRFGARAITIDSYRAADCQRRGCGGQVCSNNAGVVTTCEARPEYACYAQAVCAPQRGGHCGFTRTPELQQCLADASSQTLVAPDMPLSVPDNSPRGVSSTVVATGNGTVNGVTLSLAITHTYRGDLVVTLVSPSGTRHVVHDRDGGSADDLVLQNVRISTFDGEPESGSWTLSVVDTARADVGAVEGWSLVLE